MSVNPSDESIDYLEEHLPELFSAAVTQAYWGALASGHSVLQRDGDALMAAVPRLRMFAGPNGSGKSTLKSLLRPELLGIYIFVATDDPAINMARVRQRVAAGGHDVPEDKLRSRYRRSLENLRAAVRCASRAYVFDNSGQDLQ